eukprot:106182_1
MYCIKNNNNNNNNKVNYKIIKPESIIAPNPPLKPRKNCRAFFSGLLVGGTFKNCFVSIAYKKDNYSDYVGAGSYPYNYNAFPSAVHATFDGIAIDSNTRVIIWENPNFQGRILLDEIGPAIINNVLFKDSGSYYPCLPRTMVETFSNKELQSNFPQNVRKWSQSNMHLWSNGSVKIIHV